MKSVVAWSAALRRGRRIVCMLLVLSVVGSMLVLDMSTPASAVAPNPRGRTLVAGIHDTAINDCDGAGTQVTAPSAAELAAAARSVNSPLFPPGVTTVRVTMPWDIADPVLATQQPALPSLALSTPAIFVDVARLVAARSCMDAWLKAVFVHHLQPEIDFRRDPTYETAGGQVLMPTLAQYIGAVTSFRNAYTDCGPCADGGQVKVIGAWNEPDAGQTLLFQDGHTHLGGNSCPANPADSNCGAVMAAKMWVADYELFVQDAWGGTCSGCTVPAGDFSGLLGLTRTISGGACPNTCPYVYLYNKNLTSNGQQLRPGHWAVHPYGDTKAFQSGKPKNPTGLSQFADKLQKYGYGTGTFIWINEISVCDTPGPGTCAKQITAGHGKVAAMNYLLNTLPLSVSASGPQVGRIDYYCFSPGAQCNPDWALATYNSATGTWTKLHAYDAFETWADAEAVVHTNT